MNLDELAQRAMPPAVYKPALLMKSRRVILLIAVSPVGCLLLIGRVNSKELELKQVLIIYLLRLTDKLTLNRVSKR